MDRKYPALNRKDQIRSAFEVVSWRKYELGGVLRAVPGLEPILENIDLEQSTQLVDGKWLPLQTGDFEVAFP